jgi:hypothetical protein
LEIDVARLEKRLADAEHSFKMQESLYQEKKARYLTEKRKFDEVTSQKEKVSGQMNGLMLGFEESRQQRVDVFAEHLRQVYRKSH